MSTITKFIYAIIWFAFAIGIGKALWDFTQEMRGAAVKAYKKGPISHK